MWLRPPPDPLLPPSRRACTGTPPRSRGTWSASTWMAPVTEASSPPAGGSLTLSTPSAFQWRSHRVRPATTSGVELTHEPGARACLRRTGRQG
eukprot:4761642-Pyramimonas_sp.AAC.1